VIMSIDAHDVAKHEKNRACRCMPENTAANEVFAAWGPDHASVTASKLIEDYDKLPEFLTRLGFTSCTFSYPLTSLAQVT